MMRSTATTSLRQAGLSAALGALRPESLWVLCGQAGAAAGLLVGMRLQTQFIAPDVFGAAALLIAYGALCVGMVCTPYLQSALRFYPEMAARNALPAFRHYIRRHITYRTALLISVTLALGAVVCRFLRVPYAGVVLICVLSLVDVGRSIELAFLNAARMQRAYALWSIYEAWLRPPLAVLFVLLLGPRSEAVLLGYIVASTCSLLAFRLSGSEGFRRRPVGTEITEADKASVRHYAAPLMPLALVGWFGALSDRYAVAGLLGLREAGIYAAVSGLISRPFLMLQTSVELAIRPLYFSAVAANDRRRETAVYGRWLWLNASAALLLLSVVFGFSDLIVKTLLGQRYADGSVLVPFVAVAQFFLAISYSLNGYLYAHKHVRQVLVFTSLGAACTILLLVAFGAHWGLRGIALAGSISNLLQLAALAFVVRRADRQRAER